MINKIPELATCPRCGSYVIAGRTSGYDVAVNTTTLDAQGLALALLDGRQIYRPRFGESGNLVGLTWIKPGTEPLDETMRAEHECGSTVVYRPVTPPSKVLVPETPPRPSAGRTARSSGPQTVDCSVPSAARPRSEAVCELCEQVITAGQSLVAVQLGELYVWAQHSDACPM